MINFIVVIMTNFTFNHTEFVNQIGKECPCQYSLDNAVICPCSLFLTGKECVCEMFKRIK